METIRPAVGVRKGSWTKDEDTLLKKCIDTYGEGKWHLVPLRAGLNRCRKSCRLRWLDYLKPNIKKGSFAKDEVDLIKRLHKLLGNRWSLIAGRLPGRTANNVKNFWNTNIGRELASNGEKMNGKLVQKAITKSNIYRPRPFNLSKSHVPKSREVRSNINDTNLMKTDNENTINEHPFNDTVNDQYIEWWSNILFTTETKEKGTSFSIQEHADWPISQGEIKIGLHDAENSNPFDDQDGLSDTSIDGDLWKLLSLDDQ